MNETKRNKEMQEMWKEISRVEEFEVEYWMRKIKFRAWDEDKKEMVYEDNILHYSLKPFGATRKDTRFVLRKIMESTGLKDKNGKEIYEEDIIKYIPINAIVVIRFGTVPIGKDDWGVEHLMRGFYGEWQDDSEQELGLKDEPSNYEVIGNIYENPELIKK